MENEIYENRKMFESNKMGREQKRESILTANEAEDEQRKRNKRKRK